MKAEFFNDKQKQNLLKENKKKMFKKRAMRKRKQFALERKKERKNTHTNNN